MVSTFHIRLAGGGLQPIPSLHSHQDEVATEGQNHVLLDAERHDLSELKMERESKWPPSFGPISSTAEKSQNVKMSNFTDRVSDCRLLCSEISTLSDPMLGLKASTWTTNKR